MVDRGLKARDRLSPLSRRWPPGGARRTGSTMNCVLAVRPPGADAVTVTSPGGSGRG